MADRPTAKQCAAHAGYSISWLRRHYCGWCEQTALNAMRYGCAATWDKCDPWERLKRDDAGLRQPTSEAE